ncbi:hypothetical protein [Sulfitobacter sp.]|uniref:hypothetical protein n=1 Tax=Sulfitobacter sp. TaxID=1903071 RepID=UPI00300161FB
MSAFAFGHDQRALAANGRSPPKMSFGHVRFGLEVVIRRVSHERQFWAVNELVSDG